jgi:1-acyl-sn-glycerol-3-phosphate acyltransferase
MPAARARPSVAHVPAATLAATDHGALSERDPAFARHALPLLWPLVEIWFRPEIRGLDLIPETGPVLLVGNHSGGNVSPDTTAFTLAFIRRFGAERPFFQLAHDMVMAAPQLRLARRFGMIAASPANAQAAFGLGAAVLVYPGGDLEVHRPVWQGHRVDFHGRLGWIRVALRNRVPIVPIVSLGGQETALFLGQGERLAHALTLDRRLRLHVLPVSIALPWGLNVGDFLGHVPLPAKLQIEVLPPIDLEDRYGEDPGAEEVYADVVALMQRTLDGLAARRRWPVVG